MTAFDLIIRQGSVIDGTGAARFPADVGIVGDRIAAVERNLPPGAARREIDATGRVVAPGFIDVHNHSEGWLLKLGHLEFKTRQGITSEILMSDGISFAPLTRETSSSWLHYLQSLNGLTRNDYRGWLSIEDYVGQFEQDATRIAQNVAVQIPYGNIRAAVIGWGNEVPTGDQMGVMQQMIRSAMEAGAVGLSTGLDYIAEGFAATDELVEATRAIAPWQGLYVTHIRYQLGHVAALAEAVEIARRAGVPLHVSHLKREQMEHVDELLAAMDQTAREVDFTFDCYPYAWASSMLNMLLPFKVWREGPLAVRAKLGDPEVRQRLAAMLAQPRNAPELIQIAWLPGEANRRHIGRTLAEYAAEVGKPAEDAACDLLVEEDLAVQVVFRRGDDAAIEAFLAHPRFMLGSDGIYAPGGQIHPRCCGSAPRLLGPLVRDRKLFTLEDAVRRMTSFPAQRFGLVGRGVLRPGAFADLVVFDPGTVADRATYAAPYEPPVGIDHVLVNGVPVIAQGKPVAMQRSELPGRVLRFKS